MVTFHSHAGTAPFPGKTWAAPFTQVPSGRGSKSTAPPWLWTGVREKASHMEHCHLYPTGVWKGQCSHLKLCQHKQTHNKVYFHGHASQRGLVPSRLGAQVCSRGRGEPPQEHMTARLARPPQDALPHLLAGEAPGDLLGKTQTQRS